MVTVAHTAPDRALALVVEAMWKTFGISREDLLGRSRAQHIAWLRQIAMASLRDQFGLTSVEVGRLFQRDHGTVLHAEQAVRGAKTNGARLDVQRFLSALSAYRKATQQ